MNSSTIAGLTLVGLALVCSTVLAVCKVDLNGPAGHLMGMALGGGLAYLTPGAKVAP